MEMESIMKEAAENAKRHDWHKLSMLEHLCLVHEEISEAVKCVRQGDLKIRLGDNGKPEGLPVEIGDAIIRLCYMTEIFDLETIDGIKIKLIYNLSRPKNHGKKI